VKNLYEVLISCRVHILFASRATVYRHTNNICWNFKLTKLLMLPFYLAINYVPSYRIKCPLFPIHWRAHCTIFHLEERPSFTQQQKNELRGFSLRANYTDRANRLLSVKLVATFVDRGMWRGQRGGSLWPWSRFSGLEPLHFFPSSSSVVLTRLSGPRSRPTTSQKMW
jgi:hypothetical protein